MHDGIVEVLGCRLRPRTWTTWNFQRPGGWRFEFLPRFLGGLVWGAWSLQVDWLKNFRTANYYQMR
jgi:hypothetical protein